MQIVCMFVQFRALLILDLFLHKLGIDTCNWLTSNYPVHKEHLEASWAVPNKSCFQPFTAGLVQENHFLDYSA